MSMLVAQAVDVLLNGHWFGTLPRSSDRLLQRSDKRGAFPPQIGRSICGRAASRRGRPGGERRDPAAAGPRRSPSSDAKAQRAQIVARGRRIGQRRRRRGRPPARAAAARPAPAPARPRPAGGASARPPPARAAGRGAASLQAAADPPQRAHDRPLPVSREPCQRGAVRGASRWPHGPATARAAPG